MDIGAAAGSPIRVKLHAIPGSKDQSQREIRLSRITMEQAAELCKMYEQDMGARFAGVEDLIPYAGHPLGSLRVLRMSLANIQGKTWDQVEEAEAIAIGSLKQRCDTARVIVMEAVTTGEDALIAQEALDKRGKAEGLVTGPTRPTS